jgi:hypothetical protein
LAVNNYLQIIKTKDEIRFLEIERIAKRETVREYHRSGSDASAIIHSFT